MKKTTKSTKFIKAVLGLGTLVAFVLPASISPAYSYDPGMPVPAGLRSEAEMQGGLNYKHPEDDLMYRHYLQNVNDTYRDYGDYGRGGNPANKGDVVNGYSDNPQQGSVSQADNTSVYISTVEVSPSEI